MMKTAQLVDISTRMVANVAEFEKTSKNCAMEGSTSGKLQVKASSIRTGGAESP
jgi:hypothetical protein